MIDYSKQNSTIKNVGPIDAKHKRSIIEFLDFFPLQFEHMFEKNVAVYAPTKFYGHANLHHLRFKPFISFKTTTFSLLLFMSKDLNHFCMQ